MFVKGIGVLLISAFVAIVRAYAARLLSHKFTHCIVISTDLGVLSAVRHDGIYSCDLPFSPSIITAQLIILPSAIPSPNHVVVP